MDARIAPPLSTTPMSYSETVRARRSIRAFLPIEVPDDVIDAVHADATLAPSNCNTQPWITHVVKGATLQELSQAMLADFRAGRESLDFTFDADGYHGTWGDRRREHGAIVHTAQGLQRGDKVGRTEAGARNLEFYGAPQAVFLFLPRFGDGVRTAGDIGMYAQNFLLSLTARGLGGIPQTMLGFYADRVREILGVSEEYYLLFGISFGYADEDAPVNTARTPRDLESTIVKHY